MLQHSIGLQWRERQSGEFFKIATSLVAGEDSFSAFDGFVPLLAVTHLGHREI